VPPGHPRNRLRSESCAHATSRPRLQLLGEQCRHWPRQHANPSPAGTGHPSSQVAASPWHESRA
jgi:hypothetical protein